MKRTILLAALAASFHLHAQTIEAPNSVGGQIVLTDVQGDSCPKGQQIAYSTHPNGDALFGCWAFINNRVFIKYEDNKTRIYELDGFVVKQDKPKTKTAPAGSSRGM